MNSDPLAFFTDTVLMVRPANFGPNPETIESNAFQQQELDDPVKIVRQKAIQEFDHMVGQLRKANIQVVVVNDSEEPIKTDAVFPNNWFSTHRDGELITYPMMSPNRRLERDPAIIELLENQFHVSNRIALETYETKAQFLEGTGSIILDREHQLAYACYSPRTDAALFELFCKKTGFQAIGFDAIDANGLAIYHTNVMMAMGHTFAIVCMDSIPDEAGRQRVLEGLRKSGKELLAISFKQLNAFTGNMLMLRNDKMEAILVGSEQAFQSLNSAQLTFLQNRCQLLPIPLYTIEKYGGGSARCMIAEIYLEHV